MRSGISSCPFSSAENCNYGLLKSIRSSSQFERDFAITGNISLHNVTVKRVLRANIPFEIVILVSS